MTHSVTDSPSDIMRRALELQAKTYAERSATVEQPVQPPPLPVFNPILIPDIDSPSERTEEDRELDRILGDVDIVTAYTRWCGKMQPKVSPGRTESIMISCPKPEHADKNPSAWLNTDKQTWYCGGCQEGGDSYDIAAMRHGFPVPGYKAGAMFHKLRRTMAEDLGYTFNSKSGGGNEIIPPVMLVPPPVQSIPPPAAPAPPPTLQLLQTAPVSSPPILQVVPTPPVAPHVMPPMQETPVPAPQFAAPVIVIPNNVYSIDAASDAFDPELDSDENVHSLDWRSILHGYEDTFLYKWTEAASHDYGAEEYHLFNGLQMIGLTAGRDVTTVAANRVIIPNLSICLLGRTASGKSTSQGYMRNALNEIMPENDMGMIHEGVRLVGEVASGEALIGVFEKKVAVSSTMPSSYVPVKGMVEFDELSTILGKSSMMGSTLKMRMMQFIDGQGIISNISQTHGRRMAKDSFAAFTTGSQPKALRKLLDSQDVASGFLNRWLFVSGPKKEQFDFIGGVLIDFSKALDKLAILNVWCKKPTPNSPARTLPWDEDAFRAYNTWIKPINDRIGASDDDLLARVKAHYFKLMLCFAVNRHAMSISLAEVAFIQNIHEYVMANYKLVGAQVGMTVDQEIVDRVYNYIKRKEQMIGTELVGPSRSEMYRTLKTKNIKDKQINDAVDTLIKGNRIEEFKVNTGKRGRPSKRTRTADHD